ncbi:MAG: Asp-tRNA(Asn)/Glu-tRNA(Gln) amidotransferase subunit GatA [Gemmatimonadetes bacterium]|nr:Asp-tRNA(Asn)/Glu-tRNA(Gln) amidotransferase subunit GatA [Gemmatimonadota bacterium]
MNDLTALDVAQLHGRVTAGELAALECVDRTFDRMRQVAAGPDGLNILLAHDREWSREQAEVVDRQVASGEALGPLAGIPVVVKDNLATEHLPTTCGSRILEGYVSPYEATAVRRLRAAGALVVGKANLDEFAMGSSTEHSAFGPTRNPVDPTRVPGGSSGGSAAAVAAGVCRIALGSETGGSVRQPAAFCGVVGLKPTYGRVSRYGLVAFASSLDHVGVFGATVADMARGLQAIAGHDPRDATSAADAVDDYVASATSRDVQGLVVGWPTEYYDDALDPRIRASCETARDLLLAAGATVRPVTLPHTGIAIPTYYVLAPAEASANLARFDGARYGMRMEGDGLRGMYEATRSRGFGEEVTRRILLGTYVLSAGYYDAYYRTAMQARRLIADDFARVFATGVDVLLTPTTPAPAWPLGAISDPYEMYLADTFTVPANLAGIPAISVPAGRVDGLPIGVQLMANHFAEATLCRAAAVLEAVAP